MAACVMAMEQQGWAVSSESMKEIFDDLCRDEDGNSVALNSSDILTILLNIDLHLFGESCLKNEFLGRKKLVLQVDKIRNIARPKVCEDSGKESDRLLRVTLTDGHTTVTSLEMQAIDSLSTKTPPGTKLLLFPEKVKVERGLWLLDNTNCRIMGGHVNELIEKWRANEDTRHKPRTAGGNYAPPWVPFGSKVDTSYLTKGFAAMAVMQPTDSNAPISEEFEQTRKTVIAQAQNVGMQKTFANAPVEVPQSGDNMRNMTSRNFFVDPNRNNANTENGGRGRGRGRGFPGRQFRGRGRGGRR